MTDLLLQVLEELADVHDQLLDTGTRKKEALIKGQIDQLSALLKEEAPLIRRIGKLEEERLNVVEKLYEEKRITDKQMPLAAFLPYIEEPDLQQRLQAVYERLKATVTQLQQLNELNSKLIHDSLDYVNQSIELLADVESGSVNYQQPKQAGTDVPTRRSFFDTKA